MNSKTTSIDSTEHLLSWADVFVCCYGENAAVSDYRFGLTWFVCHDYVWEEYAFLKAEMAAQGNFFLATDPVMIEEQVRFLLESKVPIGADGTVDPTTKISWCPQLESATGCSWEKNNVVENALMRIALVRRSGEGAKIGRRKKCLHFLYNGTTYVPQWQFSRSGKLLPLVQKIVELYQKGSDDPDGASPIEDAWSSFYVVISVEGAVRQYRACRSLRSRRACSKMLLEQTRRSIGPPGW